MKDQSKKVATLKHKEQVEKNRNAQLMEEARKREDNINESSQQVKVMLGLELNKAQVSQYMFSAVLKHFVLLILFKPPFSPNLFMTHKHSHDSLLWDTWSHLIYCHSGLEGRLIPHTQTQRHRRLASVTLNNRE